MTIGPIISGMGVWDPVILAAMLMAVSFFLGATVMWAWEVRDRRVQPFWFVVTRHLTIGLVIVYAFFRPAAVGGNAIIDATWTMVLGTVGLGLTVIVFVAEVRQRRQKQQT